MSNEERRFESEHGPELFIPNVPGRIIQSNKLLRAIDNLSADMTLTITVTTATSGRDDESDA